MGGTLFPHKDIHKLTWYSPNGRDRNQIVHLLINGTWRRSLLDVKVKRGADVGSDHHLEVAILKLKLRKTGAKYKTNPRYNVSKLGELNVKNAFVLQLKNRFQELARTDDDNIHPVTEEINTKWEKVN